MCGIAGIISLSADPIPDLARGLRVMSDLLAHRGPDGDGIWEHPSGRLGLAHRRLAIVDLKTGAQPMQDSLGSWIVFNGEVYNHAELRRAGFGDSAFKTRSDTETILRAYEKWGAACLDRFRGMFAFAIWDEPRQQLFCARDRFGIKPFCYAEVGNVLYFASEAKALLPFLPAVEPDPAALKEYLTFQHCLHGRTLFRDVQELPPGRQMIVHASGTLDICRWYRPPQSIDFDHTPVWFTRELRARFDDAIRLHVMSDVPVGAYVSGGLDSGLVAASASEYVPILSFTGRCGDGPRFDETPHARAIAAHSRFLNLEIAIGPHDFVEHLPAIVRALDWPVAGPGAVLEYMVARLASAHRKVVLGGQGGDEMFGGYARYLAAYLEQCIRAAIAGTITDGRFATWRTLLPTLRALSGYEPLLRHFFRDGFLAGDQASRYARLMTRSTAESPAVRWDALGDHDPVEAFREAFGPADVGGEHVSLLDRMMRYDMANSLPGLLHVEDRMSMAHGVESRVPLLDHPLVELVMSIPADLKFGASVGLGGGMTKRVLREAVGDRLPSEVLARPDKLGMPTPVADWAMGEAREFVHDILGSAAAGSREYVDNGAVLRAVGAPSERELTGGTGATWAFMCLELWFREFIDRRTYFRTQA